MLLTISVVKCVPSPHFDVRLAISEDKKKKRLRVQLYIRDDRHLIALKPFEFPSCELVSISKTTYG